MSHDCSPDDVLDAAEMFDVDLQDEPYLAWIIREFTVNPLPPNYSKAINEVGQEGYVNDITGEGSPDHPAMVFFQSLIEKERAKQQDMLIQRR